MAERALGAAQFLRNSLQTVAVAPQQRDAHALGDQRRGDSSADSAAGTGDNSVQPGKCMALIASRVTARSTALPWRCAGAQIFDSTGVARWMLRSS